MTKPPFYRVFYIYQTQPKLHLAGFVFSRALAKDICNFLEHETGSPGKVISFTRQELLDKQQLTSS